METLDVEEYILPEFKFTPTPYAMSYKVTQSRVAKDFGIGFNYEDKSKERRELLEKTKEYLDNGGRIDYCR